MYSRRLRQIEAIYHKALMVEPDRRDSALDELCGEDAELRRELESLMVFEAAAECFLDAPPESLSAELFFSSDPLTKH